MDKIKKIVNSNWFNASAAGAVAIGFAIYGNWFACGIALGFGIKTFINVFKTPTIVETKCKCEGCECEK